MARVMADKNLTRYQGLFGEPTQEITKTYICENIEKKNIGEGFVNFWKRLFGRDKKDSINNDTTKSSNKSRREKRRERREKRRNNR
jgi:hypothetical protein